MAPYISDSSDAVGSKAPESEATSDYEVGTYATTHGGPPASHIGGGGSDQSKPVSGEAMVYRSTGWQSVPRTSVAVSFYTAGSVEHGYELPIQIYADPPQFHPHRTVEKTPLCV